MLRIFRLRLIPALRALFLVTLLGAAGCGSFNREWRRTTSDPGAVLAGRWEGSWISQVNGHHGKLRCIVAKGSEGEFQARFHARYGHVFTFGYTVKLHSVETNSMATFEGDADLGSVAGGLYHYAGSADGKHFESTYSSRYDHGKFTMQRP